MIKYGEKRYYQDELANFFPTKTNKRVMVDKNYKYLNRNIIFRLFSFSLYYIIAIPFLYVKLKFIDGVKVYGRENIKQIKTGFMLFGNHTHWFDSYLGHALYARPKRTYIIANKDAISIKGIDILTKALGALPVPDTTIGLINLKSAINYLLKKKKCIVTFPEAHIWPYATILRSFPITSFKLASEADVPCVPVAMVYKTAKSIWGNNKKPKMIAYIGKPIYNDINQSIRENALLMRDYVYNYIQHIVTKESEVSLYEYIKI